MTNLLVRTPWDHQNVTDYLRPRVGVMAHVWYVSYGSNMSAARFACYVEGGRPPGGTRTNPGCRDRTPPVRDVPVGYIFEVISRGYGGMPDYAHQIAVPDRWRIAAYVRTLQLSQNPPGGPK